MAFTPGVNFKDPIPSTLIFQPSGPTRLCFNVSIISDERVQLESQVFTLGLASSSNVRIPIPLIAVTIMESSGKISSPK